MSMHKRDGGTANASGVAHRIVAVVITYERPMLLRRCLEALHAQRRMPDAITHKPVI
jgi:hypothetical protein